MKKKMIALLAGAMMFAAMAGNAFAYFGDSTNTDYTLVRVVYDAAGTKEVATDIGTVAAGTGAVTLTNGGAASAFNLSMFGAGASWDNLYVAYFAKGFSTTDVWTSGSLTDAPTSGNRKMSTANAGVANVMSNYHNLGGTTGTVIGDQSAINSYFNQIDNGGPATGTFGTFLNGSYPGVEMNLAALAATGGFVQQAIYFFDAANSISTGVKVASLQTNADGTTTTSAVPIPPAFFLMGSGLLGMIGLRRRMK